MHLDNAFQDGNNPLVIYQEEEDHNNTPHHNIMHDPNCAFFACDIDVVICDIRNESKIMHFHFKNIAFCRTNEIIRNLFHFPKAPNALLTLFDRIIDWMKAHRKI